MPDAPLRFCSTSGCPNKVKGGKCPACRGQRERARGNRHQRGYDNNWGRYSKRRLLGHPFCVGFPLGHHGEYAPLAEVTDHIISIRERPDLKDEPSNHQSLCFDCNRRKAIALESGFGFRAPGA